VAEPRGGRDVHAAHGKVRGENEKWATGRGREADEWAQPKERGGLASGPINIFDFYLNLNFQTEHDLIWSKDGLVTFKKFQIKYGFAGN
jgi:hypothetical protein